MDISNNHSILPTRTLAIVATLSLGLALYCAYFAVGTLAQQTPLSPSGPSSALPNASSGARGTPVPVVNRTGAPAANRQVNLTGCTVFLAQKVAVSATESGLLIKIHIEKNSEVTLSQAVAQIDDRDLQIELQAARLQHQAAKQIAEDTSDTRYNEALLTEANLDLEKYEEANSRTSAFPLEIRKLKVGKLRAELAVERSKQQRDQAQLQADIRSAAMTAVQERIKRRTLTAPIPGTVTMVNKRAGEWVEVGEPIIEIARMDVLEVDALVPLQNYDPASLIGCQAQVSAVRPGVGVVNFPATIKSYDPEVDSNGEIRFHAEVQNRRLQKDWLLLPGMTVSMQFQAPEVARQVSRTTKQL